MCLQLVQMKHLVHFLQMFPKTSCLKVLWQSQMQLRFRRRLPCSSQHRSGIINFNGSGSVQRPLVHPGCSHRQPEWRVAEHTAEIPARAHHPAAVIKISSQPDQLVCNRTFDHLQEFSRAYQGLSRSVRDVQPRLMGSWAKSSKYFVPWANGLPIQASKPG